MGISLANVSELFASLLGRRIQVEEDGTMEMRDIVALKDGLRIFG